MKQDKIFTAIGGVNPELLERSEAKHKTRKPRAWIKWSIPIAACLVAALLFHATNNEPANTELEPDSSLEINETSPGIDTPENTTIPNDGVLLLDSEVGEFHFLQLSYAEGLNTAKTTDFIVYVNEGIYYSYDSDGVYTICPIEAASDGLPECKLEIAQVGGLSVTESAETIASTLVDDYTNVLNITDSILTGGLYIHADNGPEWNAEQLDLHVVDDSQGGVFVITASYFTEAIEGHGARFSDMIGTFQVVTGADDTAAWLTELMDTVTLLSSAVFGNRPSDVKDYLSDNAKIPDYGEDVSDDVSIASIDYTVDNDVAPSSAVVSVKHRLGAEDSYSYITIELIYENEKWLVGWAGIEK